MATPRFDLDLLATHLRNKLAADGLSARQAAKEIGCSPATLSRLLQGEKAPNTPDSVTIMRAISWLGKHISAFERGKASTTSTLGDVEAHLRALPGLGETDAEALVAMVKAAYETAKHIRSKKE